MKVKYMIDTSKITHVSEWRKVSELPSTAARQQSLDDQFSPAGIYQVAVLDDIDKIGEELIHGVIEHIADIDSRIKGLAHNWEFERIAKIDLAILRIAMFEMVYRKDIPPVVSINEAIDLSKQFSNADAKRFINGILDRLKDQLGRDARKAD